MVDLVSSVISSNDALGKKGIVEKGTFHDLSIQKSVELEQALRNVLILN